MSKKAQQHVRELREAALELSRKQNHAAALERLNELERLEPKEADWPRRAAECHRALGQVSEQVAALARAAERYAEAGAMAKAVAMCRMILGIEPHHTETQQRLASLQPQRNSNSLPSPTHATTAAPRLPPAPAKAPPPTERPRPPALREILRQRHAELGRAARATKPAPGRANVPAAERAQSLPHVPDVSLKDIAPNSRPIPDARGVPSGMYRIEIGELAPPSPADRAADAARKALPVTPLFSELGPQSLERVIERARLLHVERGAAVYRDADPAEALYVIVSGSIALIAEGEERTEVARLGEGEFFGETALLNSDPRGTTAEALEPTDVLVLGRETLRELVAEEPRVLTLLLRFVRERLVESSLLTNPLFTVLPRPERRRLAAHFEFLEIDPGALVIWQGVRSPGLFVLLSGSVEVRCDDGGDERLLATLHAGAVFGEMSLVYSTAAMADVRCVTRAYALLLPKAEFSNVMSAHPAVFDFVRLLAASRRNRQVSEQNAAEVDSSTR